MWRMWGPKAMALSDKLGVACACRAQDGGERCLSAAVFGIDQRQARERELSPLSHRVELPHVPKQLDAIQAHARASERRILWVMPGSLALCFRPWSTILLVAYAERILDSPGRH